MQDNVARHVNKRSTRPKDLLSVAKDLHQRLDSAILRNDVPGMLAIQAPSFTSLNPNGAKLSRKFYEKLGDPSLRSGQAKSRTSSWSGSTRWTQPTGRT